MIYNLLMPYITKMYVTQIDKEFEGDAFFPRIDENTWEVVEKSEVMEDENSHLKYEYITYKRK